MTRRLGALVAGFGLALQLGCHAYRPSYGTAPVAGTTVRVALTDAGRALVTEQLGESIDWVQGTLVSADSSTISVEATLTRSLRGGYATWIGERVQIPARGVSQVAVREFSRGRTAAFAAALTVGAVALGRLISLQVFGDGKPDGPGGCVPPNCPDA